MLPLQILLNIVYLTFAFESSVLKKIFSAVSLAVLWCMTEAVTLFLIPLFSGLSTIDVMPLFVETHSILSVLMAFMSNAVLSIFISIFILVWRKNSTFNVIGFYNTLLICVFPITTILPSLIVIEAGADKNFFVNPIIMVGGILGVISVTVFMLTLFENVRKKQAETQLRELEQRRHEEEVHYLAIEEKRSELSKIRHDFNNYISAAQALIDKRDFKSARELLEQLKVIVASEETRD